MSEVQSLARIWSRPTTSPAFSRRKARIRTGWSCSFSRRPRFRNSPFRTLNSKAPNWYTGAAFSALPVLSGLIFFPWPSTARRVCSRRRWTGGAKGALFSVGCADGIFQSRGEIERQEPRGTIGVRMVASAFREWDGGGMDNIMRSMTARRILSLAFVGIVWTACAQQPAYLDPSLPAGQRAADLVRRMTLEEKASQLVNQARAIARLKVPAYDWWSEALHGVAVNGTTEFPEPIGLAATFDAPGIHEMAVAISIEGRIKYAQALRKGHSDIFEGLDFWAPNVNIFRDPRWGRGQETYG